MGMSVLGNSPRSEQGKRFYANSLTWRSLWAYCYLVLPEVVLKVEHGFSNCGDGLGDDDSKLLAEAIYQTIDKREQLIHGAPPNIRGACIGLPEWLVLDLGEFFSDCGGFKIW